MDWKTQMKTYVNMIEDYLKNCLPQEKQLNFPVVEAMGYSLYAGGKRLRPVLTLGTYGLFAQDHQRVLPYASALEMIHTYSLIHDDLPAMDNDDYRRGKLTNHRVYGEGMAILAGDGLLNQAFEVMLKDALTQEDPRPYLESTYAIARAAGVNGMIGGQTVDLISEGKQIDKETLSYIHYHKTGALIEACFKVGAILGGASREAIDILSQVGRQLGLAFQIQDDLLDILGDEKKLGKKTGVDAAKQKATYPGLYGIEASQQEVARLTAEIEQQLTTFGPKADFLIALCRYLMHREN